MPDNEFETMRNRVLLQPAPLEYGLHQEQYDALVEELEGQGIIVRVLAPLEARGVPSTRDFYDLVIHVGDITGAIVGTANLIAIVLRRLRDDGQPRAGPRRAKVYLNNGDEHVLSLDAEDE